jgi:DNA invertase Pin-like site-specific DNA recombinase
MKRRQKQSLPATLVPTVGYVHNGGRDDIEAACGGLGLELVELTGDLGHAFERLEAGDASCLIVGELTALSDEVAELAKLLDRIEREGTRLIALDIGLDTETENGRLAVARGPARELPWAPPPEPEPEPEPEAPPPEPAVAEPPAQVAVRALGYASVPAAAETGAEELDAQRRTIEDGCKQHGLELVELIGDREPKGGKALDRPGLSHLMQRIAAGDASCVIVAGLDRLSRSVAELGTVVRWLEHNRVRLVAIDLGLDTATQGGRVTARALASVGDWERERLSERTRTGLAAARAKRHAAGGSTEPDWAALRKRIAAMRADGMTLQAIADTLNDEGVPTQRGGAKWRPSSVQSAAGYKRRTRSKSLGDLPPITPPDS